MQVRLVLQAFFLLLHASHAFSHSSCARSDVCKHYKQCKYYEEAVKQMKQEKDIKNKSDIIKDLRSRVCDKEDRLVCCPIEKHREIKHNETLESPSYLPPPGECGNIQENRITLIFGGKETDRSQFPFTALVGVARKVHEEETDWVCGGTLINLWYVVTAAQCHQQERITRVRLGEEDSLVQDFDIFTTDIAVHERYKPSITSPYNDIALIRLPSPAQLNRQVGVACLPLSQPQVAHKLRISNLGSGLVGESITIIGSGYTGYEEDSLEFSKDDGIGGSMKQKSLEMAVLHQIKCQAQISSSMFCAGGKVGEDICKGDMGGGAFLRDKVTSAGSWYLVGIGSSGSRFCGSGKPRIFTRITKYLPWIRKQINE